MVVYNETFMENSTNIAELFTGFGTSVGAEYLIGYMILLSVMMILFITLKGSISLASKGVTVFSIGLVLSFLLIYAGMLPVIAGYGLIGLLVVSLIGYLSL